MRKSSSDFLCGLAFLAVSIAFALQMGTLEGKSLIFPRTLAAVIALGELWFMGKGLILRRLEKNPHPHGDPVAWKLVTIIAVVSMGYALLILWLGFFSATFLFVVTASLLLGDRARGLSCLLGVGVLYSLIFVALIWLVFVKLLSVPTPSGLLF